MTALVRFVIQWIRVYEPFVGPLGFAHVVAMVVMGVGLYLLLTPPPAGRAPAPLRLLRFRGHDRSASEHRLAVVRVRHFVSALHPWLRFIGHM